MGEPFTNPSFVLSERSLISKGHARFNVIISNLIKEFSKTNPTYYCTKHHSLETRNTSKQQRHQGCDFLTRAEVIGKL